MSSRLLRSGFAVILAASLAVLSACSSGGVSGGVSSGISPAGLSGRPGPVASEPVSTDPTRSEGPSDESSGGTPSAVCDLVDPEVVGTIVGAPVTGQSAADTACVYSTADSQESVEILRLPSSVLADQLSHGSLTPVQGVGDKAYWNETDGTLFAVKADSELAVQATLNSTGPAVERACVAVAKAALRAL